MSNETAKAASARRRAKLATLRARYDGATVSPAIYKVIKELETQVAWLEQRQ